MDKKYPLGKVINLGSSSKGNSFYIELYRKDYPNPFRLLIECGFEFPELSKRLLDKGISINDINAILVTHEHKDHSASVPTLVARKKKVFAPLSVYERYGISDKVERGSIITEKTTKGIADGITVLGMPLDHENDDGSKTYNLGYIITVDSWFNILFITDTKHIRWNLSEYQFNVIFIEANNLHRVIYNAIKNAIENHNKWEEIHYNRVLKSHMLVENTGKTLQTFDLSKTDIIFLIHLSANTIINTFEFKDIVKKYLKENNQFRTVSYMDKKTKLQRTTLKPRIVIAKRNGDFS